MVNNIPSVEGKLRAAVFDSPDGFPSEIEQSVQYTSKKVEGDSMEIVFRDIAFGEYVIVVFHDENNNGSLDTNSKGIPTEALGVSGNAKMNFGPPRYNRATFLMENEAMEMQMELQQFKVGTN